MTKEFKYPVDQQTQEPEKKQPEKKQPEIKQPGQTPEKKEPEKPFPGKPPGTESSFGFNPTAAVKKRRDKE